MIMYEYSIFIKLFIGFIMDLCIYIFISKVVRKGYFDPHSISEGGSNAHLKVVCQPPIKKKKKFGKASCRGKMSLQKPCELKGTFHWFALGFMVLLEVPGCSEKLPMVQTTTDWLDKTKQVLFCFFSFLIFLCWICQLRLFGMRLCKCCLKCWENSFSTAQWTAGCSVLVWVVSERFKCMYKQLCWIENLVKNC